jgi:hypothetical protein
MRRFIAGLLVGAGVVGLAWWATARDDEDRAATSPSPRDVQPPKPRPPANAATPRAAAPRRRETPAAESDVPPFPAGEAELRLGEGYVFGEDHVRPRDDVEAADVVCMDIGEPTSLRCPAGGAAAGLTLGAFGLPADPKAVAALAADAPEDLPEKTVSLATRSTTKRPGIAFVRSTTGATYKVFAFGATWNADALLRTVRIGYAEVPRRAGGGSIVLPTSTPAAGAPPLADLRSIMEAGAAVPGSDFTNFLNGAYERISSMPVELSLADGKYLLLDEPLATSVEFNAYSGLVASRGVAATGKVRIKSYTGVAVRGEMAGEIDVHSYAYVHVSGNLTGKLYVRSYATVVIDGDLSGEVEASSYTTLLLRGRLTGKLTIRSGGSKFWFQQYLPRSTVEGLAADGGHGNELHLRESDLSAGKYDDVPGWRTVVVGEDAWRLIAR